MDLINKNINNFFGINSKLNQKLCKDILCDFCTFFAICAVKNKSNKNHD